MGWVIVFAAVVTLLIPVVHVTTHERLWERKGIDYSDEIRFDVWQIASVVALLIVLFSLVTPNFSIPRLVWSFWELISRPQAVIQDLLIRFFGGVEPDTPPELPVSSASTGGRPAVAASLPNAHLLGGNPDLSQQRVMYVCIDAPPPMIEDFMPPEEAFVGPKYYWRGITYDAFGGWYWRNGLSTAR